jgi:hypothetical protein
MSAGGLGCLTRPTDIQRPDNPASSKVLSLPPWLACGGAKHIITSISHLKVGKISKSVPSTLLFHLQFVVSSSSPQLLIFFAGSTIATNSSTFALFINLCIVPSSTTEAR